MNPNEALPYALSCLESSRGEQIPQAKQQVLKVLQGFQQDQQAYNFCLLKTAEFLANSKEIDDQTKLQHYEDLMSHLLRVAVSSKFAVGIEALRYLFDVNNQYYKYNMLDRNLDFPIGRANPLPRYSPQVNEECDVVKPYITTTSPCSWVRCTILSINSNNTYTIKFANAAESTTPKDPPLFAPFGTRCKDHDWRMALKPGDTLDAQDNKYVWYYSTIVENTEENGVRKVRVTFREFSEHGDKLDAEGRKYFGWGANEDEWLDIMSPRIQKPHTMHKRLCYYSSTVTNEYFMDDSYDILYLEDYKAKPFYAVLRSILNKSQTLISLFDQFVKLGGINILKESITHSNNIDLICHLCVIAGNTAGLPPRMATNELYGELLELVNQYVRANAKLLTTQRMGIFDFLLEQMSRRLMTLTEKHDMFQNLRKDLVIILLPLNLEKQLLALRLLNDVMKPSRPYTAGSKQRFLDYLVQNEVFSKVFQPNTHEQVLTRAAPFLKFLLDNNLIQGKEIEYLWRLFPVSDFRGRAVLEKLISEVVPEMNHELVEALVYKIIEIKETDVTIDNLALLRALKNKLYSKDCIVKTLSYLWDLLTIKSANVKPAVQEEVEKVFKGFIATLQDYDVKFQLLNDMVRRLKQIKTSRGEPALLKEYIGTYKAVRPITQTCTSPASLSQVLAFLISQDIYSILFNLICNQKGDEKIKELLQFLKFLILNDSQSDLGDIVKKVFQKLGPNDYVLNWLKDIADKATSFLIWFFTEESTVIGSFKDLSQDGFKAIQSMFIDLNAHLKNLNYLKGKITVQPKGTNTNDDQKDVIEIEYTTKRDFLFVLCDPTKLQGMVFLERLLQVVSNQMVYTKIIQFIISLMVSLDESLFDQTISFRRRIIDIILGHINPAQFITGFTDQQKLKLVRNLSLLSQLMVETEIKGLFDIEPHFQIMEPELINLKVENHIVNNKEDKEIELIVNDSITLWKLRKLVGQRLKENPDQIRILRAKKAFDNRENGRAIRQLYVTKGDTLIVDRANVAEIPRYSLISDDTTGLSQKFISVVEKWFNMFKSPETGLMTAADLLRFYKDHTRATITEEEAVEAVTKHGSSEALTLTLDEFKSYIYTKAIQNTDNMWKFLNLSGYRNDFKYKDDPERTLPVQALARYILANEFVYNLLFQLLQNPLLKASHSQIYRFVVCLPTNERVRFEINDINPCILDNVTCVYELSYLSSILLDAVNRDPNVFNKFAERGGIEHLCSKLESYKFDDKGNIYELEDKAFISNSLKLICDYCFMALQTDQIVYTLFTQKLNLLQLNELDDILKKKVCKTSQQQVIKSVEFVSNVKIDYARINTLAYVILKNLMINMKNNFSREVTTETTTLCTILGRVNSPNMETLFQGLLVDSLNLRRAAMNILYLCTITRPEELIILTKRLVENIPVDPNASCTQYFDLLCMLLKICLTSKQPLELNWGQLAESLIKKILEYKPTEKRNNVITDWLLKGYLDSLSTILVNKPELCKPLSIYKVPLFNKCLFFHNPKERIESIEFTKQNLTTQKQSTFFEDYVSCKSDTNRKIIYDIVVMLYKGSPEDSEFLEKLILPILDTIPFKPRKPSTKDLMVGLYNPGCICYINAMLQMLNICQPFRNGMIMSEPVVQANIVFELQRLLSYLFFSERQDFLPEDFLKCFNPPINPLVQQDTTEFLSYLFDCLEHQLKGSSYEHLIRSLFQGTTIVQMVCHSCGKKRERKEEFFNYAVRVKDKNTLNEALEGMHVGQIINDFLCEHCNKRSDFTQRSVLGDIPNVMFIHLQRIVFNLDLFMNTKIHSRLQFPMELNIEPYTKEGVELREGLGIEYLKKLSENEDEQKKFKERTAHSKAEKNYVMHLKGIIVHSGSADVGHYYTILQEDGRWIKLDDSRTSFFTTSSFESQCFGGTFTTSDEWAHLGEQSKNAYVLIYEREVKNPIKLELTSSNKDHELAKLSDITPETTNLVNCSSFKTYNLPKLFRQVWLDNHNLMVETHVLGERYSKDFINFLENLIVASVSKSKADLISDVFFKLASQSGQIGKLIDIFETCTVGSVIYNKYLSTPKRVTDMLFHNEKAIRMGMARYLAHVLIGMFAENEQAAKEPAFNLINFLLSLLNTDIAKNWNKSESFFLFMKIVVEKSVQFRSLYDFICSKHLIAQYIDFIMQKDSPIKLTHKRYQMGNKYVAVDFASAIHTIFFLLQRSYLLCGLNVELERPPEDMIQHLNREEVLALSCMQFYMKMIKEKQALNEIGFIVHRLAINNIKFSEEISRVVLTCLNQTMSRTDEVRPIMFIARKLIEIVDEHSYARLEFLIGYGHACLPKSHTLSSVDQQIYMYSSTIQDIFPVECILNYLYMNRSVNQHTAVCIIVELLAMANSEERCAEYLYKQPSPSNTSRLFYEWMRPYLLNVKSSLIQQKITEQVVDKLLQEGLDNLAEFQLYVQKQPPHKTIVTGAIVQKVEGPFAQVPGRDVWFAVNTILVYSLKSEPNFEESNNFALAKYTNNGKLTAKNVEKESTILYFLSQTDAPIPLGPSEKPKQEETVETSGIAPIFDEIKDIEKDKTNKKPGPWDKGYKPEWPPEDNANAKTASKNDKMQIQIPNQIPAPQLIPVAPPEPPVRIDVQGIFVCDFYKEVVVENREDTQNWIRIEFDNKKDYKQLNCVLPTCVSDTIRAKDKETMITLSKFDYEQPWGEINLRVVVDVGTKHKKVPNAPPANYKIYSGVSDKMEEEPPMSEPVQEPPAQQPQPVDNHKMESEVADDQKQCPVCTLFNTLTAEVCQVCGNPF